MKWIFFAFFSIPMFVFGQDDYKLLKAFNGIEVYYKMNKIKETRKKLTYTVEIMYKNCTDADKYYNGMEYEEQEFSMEGKKPVFKKVTKINSAFAYVNFPGSSYEYNKFLYGDATGFEQKGIPVMVIKKNKEYYYTAEYIVKKEVDPGVVAMPFNAVEFRGSLQ